MPFLQKPAQKSRIAIHAINQANTQPFHVCFIPKPVDVIIFNKKYGYMKRIAVIFSKKPQRLFSNRKKSMQKPMKPFICPRLFFKFIFFKETLLHIYRVAK